MAARGIGTALLTYMADNPNRLVTIDELVDEFRDDYDRRQIMSNMANVLQTEAGSTLITRVQQGVWKYVEESGTTDRASFSVVKWYKDGGAILMDNDETVYRLTKLG